MESVLGNMTLAGDARPDDLRQAIEVDRLDAKLLFEIAAHRIAPGLGAEHADAQRKLAHVDAHGLRDLGDVERIGRCGAQDMRAEIPHQRDLPLGHAAGHRHHGAAETLRAIVRAEPAGEGAEDHPQAGRLGGQAALGAGDTGPRALAAQGRAVVDLDAIDVWTYEEETRSARAT